MLGKGGATKSDEFSEKFQRAGGHFQSKNLYCRFWTFIKVFFGCFPKKLQYDFPKMRGGGSKAVKNFSENSSDLVAPPFP